MAGLVAALAACLLIGVFWVLSSRDNDALLALAQRDINEGNAARAFERVSQYLKEKEGTASRSDLQKAKALLEESGYQAARRGIQDGNVKRVEDIVEAARQKGAGSGRLANLRIQAQRRFAAENALAVKGTLVDYGFELNGQSYEKSLPSMDAAEQLIDASFTAAVAAHPDTLQLRLNFGQFLLEQQPSRALEQFLVAERIDPSNALAQTGIGLAMFQSGQEGAAPQALPHFEKAAELLPRDLDANLNLAICLTRLGQRDAARRRFETALTLCTDPALRQRIEKALGSR